MPASRSMIGVTFPRVLNLIIPGVALSAAITAAASAQSVPTEHSKDYLLIGRGPVNTSGGQPGVGQAVNINNFEIGANKAPVPSTSGFLLGGSSGGPGLFGNVPNIPLSALPLFSGVCGDGNVAVTHLGGVFNLQDVGVFADLGIHTAATRSAADVGTSNSFFNDPHFFPNTFISTGLVNDAVNHNTGGTGVFVGPSDAVQSTRIDDPRFAGVIGGFDFAALRAELVSARAALNALASTGTLNLTSSGGKISTDRVITLSPGLNVIDIITGGNDFLLENSNLVIDGPADSRAVFRIPDNANFLISNGNILVGTGGIGLTSVLFYTDRPDNAGHFNFNNTILNGIAFWSLGLSGGEIVINNAQGCTQLVADKINLNDVRFCRCEFVAAEACPCPGDADGSGVVDFLDTKPILASWGHDYNANPSLGDGLPTPTWGDANCDGVVNFDDLTDMLTYFNVRCNP